MKKEAEAVGEHADFDSMKNCQYMDAVIKETLRLRPPIIIMMRRVVKDMEFKGYTIRDGTIVCVAQSLSHRLTEFYTNPDNFEPERFLPDRAEDTKKPYAYLAFGAGKHGKQFALLSILIIFLSLHRRKLCQLTSQDYLVLVA